MKPQRPPLTKLNFIEPMYARLVNELPEGRDWLYEVKFDGYRCLAGRDSTGLLFGPGKGTSSQTNSRISPVPVNTSRPALLLTAK
jgi:hypothetical protein